MKAIEGLVNYATFLLNFHAHFTIIMDLMNLTKSESQNIREPIKVSAEKKRSNNQIDQRTTNKIYNIAVWVETPNYI